MKICLISSCFIDSLKAYNHANRHRAISGLSSSLDMTQVNDNTNYSKTSLIGREHTITNWHLIPKNSLFDIVHVCNNTQS